MVNPKSLKNLKQFQVGNTPAHVKSVGDVSLAAAIKRYAKEHPEEIDALAAVWFKNAKRSAFFAGILLERIDGKVAQPEEHSGKIVFEVKYDRNEVGNATQQS